MRSHEWVTLLHAQLCWCWHLLLWDVITRVNLDHFSSSIARRLHSLWSAFAEQQSESAAQLFIVSKSASALRPLSLIIWPTVANGNAPHPHYSRTVLSPILHTPNTFFSLWTGGYPFCTPLLVSPAYLLACAHVFRHQLTAQEEPDWSFSPTGRGGSKVFVESQVGVANTGRWLFYFASILTASSSLTGLFRTLFSSFYLLPVRRNILYSYFSYA